MARAKKKNTKLLHAAMATQWFWWFMLSLQVLSLLSTARDFFQAPLCFDSVRDGHRSWQTEVDGKMLAVRVGLMKYVGVRQKTFLEHITH